VPKDQARALLKEVINRKLIFKKSGLIIKTMHWIFIRKLDIFKILKPTLFCTYSYNSSSFCKSSSIKSSWGFNPGPFISCTVSYRISG